MTESMIALDGQNHKSDLNYCESCSQHKRKSDFYFYKKTGKPHLNCKSCIAEQRLVKQSTMTEAEKDKERSRRQRSKTLWKKRNPEKYKASRRLESKRRHSKQPRTATLLKAFRIDRQRHLEQGRLTFHESWQDWIKTMASDDWLKEYYSTIKKPWHDHRLDANEKSKLKRKLCPEFAIYDRLRSAARKQAKDGNVAESMRRALKTDGGSNKVEALCGYSIGDLKKHLESLFTTGMSWAEFNTGSIHIDHIIPKSIFDCSIQEELEDCWSLDNLQPLWASENLNKRQRACAQDACPILWMKYGNRVETVEASPDWLKKSA